MAVPEDPLKNIEDYMDQMEMRMRTAFEMANKRLKTGTQRTKKRYDARVKPI
jgi:hypothetical protein